MISTQVRSFVIVVILGLLAAVDASCPDEEYVIALRGSTKFSVDSNGTCRCARFINDDGSSAGDLVSSSSFQQLQAVVSNLVSVVDGLVAWGRLGTSCATDNDCRRLYTCDVQLHKCLASNGSPCTASSDCTGGLSCSAGTCAASGSGSSTGSVGVGSSTTGPAGGGSSSTAPDILYTWGANDGNQLGQNRTSNNPRYYVARAVVRPAEWNGVAVKKLFSGVRFSLVQMADWTWWAWGTGEQGQLGTNRSGVSEKPMVPVRVVSPAAWVGQEVLLGAVGASHNLIYTSGGLYVWGYNVFGQLGDGTTVNKLVPTLVTPSAFGSTPIKILAAGSFYSMAVLNNDNVYYWGSNQWGNGDGTTSSRTTPGLLTQVPRASGETILAVACGIGSMHTLLLTSTGNMYAWGYGQYGQLGDGAKVDRTTVTAVPKPAAWNSDLVVSINIGQYHSFAMTASGAIYGWGYNLMGQLGLGDTTDRAVPTLFTPPSAWTSNGLTVSTIKSLAQTTFVQLSDASLWSFGYNEFGELAANITGSRSSPVPMTRPASWGVRQVVNWVVSSDFGLVQLA